jgi:hypothetical protein
MANEKMYRPTKKSIKEIKHNKNASNVNGKNSTPFILRKHRPGRTIRHRIKMPTQIDKIQKTDTIKLHSLDIIHTSKTLTTITGKNTCGSRSQPTIHQNSNQNHNQNPLNRRR